MSNPSSTGTPDSGGAHNSAPPGAPPSTMKEPAAAMRVGDTMKEIPAWVFGTGGLLGVAGLITGAVYLFGGFNANEQQQAQIAETPPPATQPVHVECNNDCDRDSADEERRQPAKAAPPEPVDEPYVLAQANTEPADDDDADSSELPEKAATAKERLEHALCQNAADKERVWAVEWHDGAGQYLCVQFCNSANRQTSLSGGQCKSKWLAINSLAQSNATERSGDDDLDQWRLPVRLPGNDFMQVKLDDVDYDLDRPVVQLVPSSGATYYASGGGGGSKPGTSPGKKAEPSAAGGPWTSQRDHAALAARVDRNSAGILLLNQRVTVVEQQPRRPVPFSHQAERWHASSSGM